jgi:hypothetical protein
LGGESQADFRHSKMLTQKDRWVGKAITDARIAYECWTALWRREIKIEPEFLANQPGGSYATIFMNYTKGAFLGAVAVLHRGFFKMPIGKPGTKTKVAYRMQEEVPEERIDEFLRLAQPFREFGNFDEHRENPNNPRVGSIQFNQPRPTIGTPSKGFIDPFPIYELLKSLEPAIGYAAFREKAI